MFHNFAVVQVIDPHYHRDIAIHNMEEAELLVETYGGKVLAKSIQHRVTPNLNTYIGEGKIEWLKQEIVQNKIEVVVLNSIVNAGQIFRLEKKLWEVNPQIVVWDKVDLILNIFDQHATTNEARLQIELACVQHMGPRIYGLGGSVLSRQGGGIGTRGLGETNLEIERRKSKKIAQKIRQQLKTFNEEQETRMKERKKLGITTVALVGYTSAGKTTLFNALTGKSKQTNQALFTTLESIVGKVKLPEFAPTVLISDTIGFIEDLPPFLIEAFRSTLLESLSAEILFHVIDSVDPRRDKKIEIVEKILTDLTVTVDPILLFNKIDELSLEEKKLIEKKYAKRKKIFISAKNKDSLGELKKFLTKKFISPVAGN